MDPVSPVSSTYRTRTVTAAACYAWSYDAGWLGWIVDLNTSIRAEIELAGFAIIWNEGGNTLHYKQTALVDWPLAGYTVPQAPGVIVSDEDGIVPPGAIELVDLRGCTEIALVCGDQEATTAHIWAVSVTGRRSVAVEAMCRAVAAHDDSWVWTP